MLKTGAAFAFETETKELLFPYLVILIDGKSLASTQGAQDRDEPSGSKKLALAGYLCTLFKARADEVFT